MKTNPAYLATFNKLFSANKSLIAKFTDDAAGSTLSKFLDDCDDASFLAYINDQINNRQVRGFLAHKPNVLTASDYETIADILEGVDEISKPLVKKWLEYGDNMSVFNANREAGTAFGNLKKSQMMDKGSAAYKALSDKLTAMGLDISDYSIYSQVQLYLKGDCIAKENIGYQTLC